MMWESLALQKISQAINHALRTDRFSLEHLAQLHGKSLALKVTHTPIHWFIAFHHEGVSFKIFTPQDQPSVSIEGTPSSLLRFAKTEAHTQLLMDKHIHIHGDLQILFELKKIQQHLRIDWEALLANHIGDFAANRLMLLAQKTKNHFNTYLDSLKNTAFDYVHYEANLIPTRVEIEDFYQQLKDFRRDLENFERALALRHQQKPKNIL